MDNGVAQTAPSPVSY